MHRPSSVPSSYSHSRQACRWAVELAGQLFPHAPALILLVAPCSSQSPRPATRQTAARQASSSSPTRKGESIHLSLTPTPAPTLTQKYHLFQPMRHQLPSRRLVTTTTTMATLPRYEIYPPTAYCLFPRHSEGALGTKKPSVAVAAQSPVRALLFRSILCTMRTSRFASPAIQNRQK